jgi:hypothetical protein
MGKSSHDITPVTKEHRMRLTQNDTPINKERNNFARGHLKNLGLVFS